jgi:hypothetical protein
MPAVDSGSTSEPLAFAWYVDQAGVPAVFLTNSHITLLNCYNRNAATTNGGTTGIYSPKIDGNSGPTAILEESGSLPVMGSITT